MGNNQHDSRSNYDHYGKEMAYWMDRRDLCFQSSVVLSFWFLKSHPISYEGFVHSRLSFTPSFLYFFKIDSPVRSKFARDQITERCFLKPKGPKKFTSVRESFKRRKEWEDNKKRRMFTYPTIAQPSIPFCVVSGGSKKLSWHWS